MKFLYLQKWVDDHEYDETLRAFDTSLQKLQMDYVDLYLVHWTFKEWNNAHGISTIPKSSSKLRLKENFDCLLFNLSADDVIFMGSFNETFRICDDPASMF